MISKGCGYRVELLEDRLLLSATMLKDIYAGQRDQSSYPSAPVQMGGDLYYTAASTDTNQLWKTDGTSTGTQLVKDLKVSYGFASPKYLTVLGSKLLFVTFFGAGPQLWVSDGTTAGTAPIFSSFTTSSPGTLPGTQAVANKFFFAAQSSATSVTGLFVSDGTAAGSIQLTPTTSGAAGSSAANLVNLNGELYFTADDGHGMASIWRSDGTIAGTQIVSEMQNLPLAQGPTAMAVAGKYLILLVPTTLTLDGKPGSRELSFDGSTFTAITVDDSPVTLYQGGNYVFAVDGGGALGVTDGTPAGSRGLDTVVNTSPLLYTGGMLYYTRGFTNGEQLWKTGVSSAPVQLFTPPNAVITGWTTFGSDIVFGTTGSGITQVYITDGTAANTVAIASQTAQPWTDTGAVDFGNGNGFVFFGMDDSVHGMEPWITDGTSAGTRLLLDQNTEGISSNPQYFTKSGNWIYFVAADDVNGTQLWKTDGTPQNTSIVDVINPGVGSAPPLQYGVNSDLTDVNGTLYFVANDGVHGDQVWRSDGTQAGTVMVTTSSQSNGASPTALCNVNGTLYFSMGYQLWESDGSTAGTKPLFALSSYLPRLLAVNNSLVINDGGTLEGLNQANSTKIVLGPADTSPYGEILVGNTLYYLVSVQPSGQPAQIELYSTNGTTATMIKNFGTQVSFGFSGDAYPANIGSKIYFVLSDAGGGVELWQSDGTAAGTVAIPGLPLYSNNYGPTGLTNLNGSLIFTQDDGVHGRELWKTDLTPQGTTMLADINPGPVNAFDNPTHGPFQILNGVAFFSAIGGDGGRERIWQTDGTTARTALAANLDAVDYWTAGFVVIGQRLFVKADDLIHGYEPWSVTPLSTSISGTVFNDANNNGTQDTGEFGMQGVTIYLDLNHDGQFDSGDVSTTTDSSGNYSFQNLTPGTYTVREVVPSGDVMTSPTGYVATVSLALTQDATGPSFGNVNEASVTMNLAYFMAVARNFGRPGTFATGDANGDGIVNLADLLLVTRHFGKTLVVNPLIVTSTLDDGSLGTLRYAIAHSNAGDTITFDPAVFAPGTTHTLTLNGSQLELTHNLTIQGSGSANLSISGNNASRIFQIDTSVTASILGLTLTAANAGTAYGGAINNSGTLDLANCSITSSTATDGGGLYSISGSANVSNCTFSNDTASAYGGALFNDAQATSTVTGCTFISNSAGHGGALLDYGTALVLINDTITQNSSTGSGGGINNVAGNLIVTNCTIVNNTTGSAGGGIYNGQTATINNSIVAENTTTSASPTDLAGNSFAGSNNLIGDGSGGLSASNHNLLGSTSNLLNPKLGSLANNGGPTLTFMPLSGSPVIDAGSNALVPSGISTDQRGYGRIFNGTVDIGAVEFGASLTPALTSATQQPASTTTRRRV